jgi:superfamily II DNA or RNA helicase
MEPSPGARVRARGLDWDVIEVEPLGQQQRMRLRCASGDLAGLEWDLLSPAETVSVAQAELRPDHPGTLQSWRLYHAACLLDQLPGPAQLLATQPGRLTIEPYQLVPMLRALDMPRPRLLLADGVGLGKTIQAGLIAAELIARRQAHRILIVVPAGALLVQWDQELRSRFGLRFTRLASAADLREARNGMELGGNPFNSAAMCLTSLDFAKQEQVLEHLERAAWDLAIIDEAHHCADTGAAGDAILRRRLAEVVARRSDGLLLLSATPHDGHDPHFASLLALLDPSLLDGDGKPAGQAYRQHVVRRLKCHIIDPATGRSAFRERRIVPVRIDPAALSEPVRAFHRELSALVAPRLKRAAGDDRFSDALAFVSLLKRSVSTIAACMATLMVVAARLGEPASQDKASRDKAAGDKAAGDDMAARRERARALRAYRRRIQRFGVLEPGAEDDAARLEAEEIAAACPGVASIQALLALGAIARRHDPKLAALLTEIRLIRIAHPRANVLVYTEYADSQAEAIAALRAARGLAGDILAISGHNPDIERTRAAERFAADDALILVSTDSLAEGLNLHRRCHHLIHLDLPYNPNRLEQRNGRIDRYGQRHDPDIRYLYLGGTFEERLLLRLIAKYEKARHRLEVMPDTLGVTADTQDTEAALMAGFAEQPASLFPDDTPAIRTLDRAAEETHTAAYRELLREIDRAYHGFDQMAARHGWLADRGLNADTAQLSAADAARRAGSGLVGQIDLFAFTTAALGSSPGAARGAAPEGAARGGPAQEAAQGGVQRPGGPLPVPAEWAAGADSVAAREMAADRMPIGWDRDAGAAESFIGQVHPLVRRAVTHARRVADDHTDARVSAARGDAGAPFSVLLTFSAELRDATRSAFQQLLAVLVPATGATVEIAEPSGWLRLGAAERAVPPDGLWQRCFAGWVPARMPEATALAAASMARIATAFTAHRAATLSREEARLAGWLRVRADALCGAAIPVTADLFGSPSVQPAWRTDAPPADRLAAYAAEPAHPAPRRREANFALEHAAERLRALRQQAVLAAPILRPIGLLMLVPPNAES